MDSQYDWYSCDEIQLQAVLLAKNLNYEGSKSDLVNRILNHEAALEAEKEKEDRVDTFPKLYKSHFKHGYEMTSCLKTVIVNPYQHSLLKLPGIAKIFDDAPSFTIQKARNGNCAALLRYDTIDAGNSICLVLRDILKDTACDVSHPLFPSVQGNQKIPLEFVNVEDSFQQLFEPAKGDLIPRLVIVENLPASTNVDEKLNELFPDAIKTISFQYNPTAQGIAVLEFVTEEAVETFLQKLEDTKVTVEGRKVLAHKFNERNNQWQKEMAEHNKAKLKNKKNKKGDAQNAQEPKGPAQQGGMETNLTTGQRILLSKAIQAFQNEPTIENSYCNSGMEKIVKFTKKNDILRNVVRVLGADTRRRLKEGQTVMPEPAEIMADATQKLVDKAIKVSSENAAKTATDTPAESGHMAKIKIYEQQRRQHEAERLRLEGIIRSMEGQLKGSEKIEWDQIKSGGYLAPAATEKSEGTKDTSVQPSTKQSLKEEQLRLLQQAQIESQKKNAMATMRLIEANKAMGGPGFGRGRGGTNRGRGGDNRGRGGANRGRGADNRGRGADNRGRGGANHRGGFNRGRGGAYHETGGAHQGRGGAYQGRGRASQRGGANRGRGGGQRGRGFAFGQGHSNVGMYEELPPPPIPDFLGKKRKAGNDAYEAAPPYKRQENPSHFSATADPSYLEGLASAIDNKMKKLEEMQEQTLRTQQQLLQRTRDTGLLGDKPSHAQIPGVNSQIF